MSLFTQLDKGNGESSVEVASASVMLVSVLGTCILCTCISFGCFALTTRRPSKVTKALKADALTFDNHLTGKEKQYKQRVAPATDVHQDVTVCIANARQNARNLEDDPDTTSTASVAESPLPSPTSPSSRTEGFRVESWEFNEGWEFGRL